MTQKINQDAYAASPIFKTISEPFANNKGPLF